MVRFLRRVVAFIAAHVIGEAIGLAAIAVLLLVLPGFAGGWFRNFLLAYVFVTLVVLCILGAGAIAVAIQGRNR